jgi:uncharacterized protein YyaL (SSP411 family)
LEVASAYYDIGTAGEMHHNPSKNVLFVASSIPQIALQTKRSEQETELLLKTAQARLRVERSRRQAPFVDHTRYTNWNAMMASAMLRAKAVLGDDWAGGHAVLTLERMRQESSEADAVSHTPGGIAGLLDDQVQTAAASLDAYEMTGDQAWLEWSVQLMDRVWTDYHDPGAGGLFDTARGGDEQPGLLPAKAKPVQDTPTPSPNGVAGIVAARLYEMTLEPRWRERGTELLTAFAGRARELGLYAATYLLAVDWHLNTVTHLVVVTGKVEHAGIEMHREALRGFLPRRVVQLLDSGHEDHALPPALSGMVIAGRAPCGYACTGSSCSPPAEDPRSWQATLETLKPTASV